MWKLRGLKATNAKQRARGNKKNHPHPRQRNGDGSEMINSLQDCSIRRQQVNNKQTSSQSPYILFTISFVAITRQPHIMRRRNVAGKIAIASTLCSCGQPMIWGWTRHVQRRLFSCSNEFRVLYCGHRGSVGNSILLWQGKKSHVKSILFSTMTEWLQSDFIEPRERVCGWPIRPPIESQIPETQQQHGQALKYTAAPVLLLLPPPYFLDYKGLKHIKSLYQVSSMLYNYAHTPPYWIMRRVSQLLFQIRRRKKCIIFQKIWHISLLLLRYI